MYSCSRVRSRNSKIEFCELTLGRKGLALLNEGSEERPRKGLRRKDKNETPVSRVNIENVVQKFLKIRALGRWSERAKWEKACPWGLF